MGGVNTREVGVSGKNLNLEFLWREARVHLGLIPGGRRYEIERAWILNLI